MRKAGKRRAVWEDVGMYRMNKRCGSRTLFSLMVSWTMTMRGGEPADLVPRNEAEKTYAKQGGQSRQRNRSIRISVTETLSWANLELTSESMGLTASWRTCRKLPSVSSALLCCA